MLQQPDDEFFSSSTEPVEKFLIKWAHASYLHVSWETQKDLSELVRGSVINASIKKFLERERKGPDLFEDLSPGEYFPPAHITVDRVLQIDDEEVDVQTIDWKSLPRVTMNTLTRCADGVNGDGDNGDDGEGKGGDEMDVAVDGGSSSSSVDSPAAATAAGGVAGDSNSGGIVDAAVVDADVTKGETKGDGEDEDEVVARVEVEDEMDQAFYDELAQEEEQGLDQDKEDDDEEEEEDEQPKSKGNTKGRGKGNGKGKIQDKGQSKFKVKSQAGTSTKSKNQSRPVINQALHGAKGWVLVKWEGLSYSESSLEYLPDLLQWKYPTLAPPLR